MSYCHHALQIQLGSIMNGTEDWQYDHALGSITRPHVQRSSRLHTPDVAREGCAGSMALGT